MNADLLARLAEATGARTAGVAGVASHYTGSTVLDPAGAEDARGVAGTGNTAAGGVGGPAAGGPTSSAQAGVVSYNNRGGPGDLDNIIVDVRKHRTAFFDIWGERILAFVQDKSKIIFEFPAELSSNDRRELHQLASKFNLRHISEGENEARRLILKKDDIFFNHFIKTDAQTVEDVKNKDLEVFSRASYQATGALMSANSFGNVPGRGASYNPHQLRTISSSDLHARTKGLLGRYNDKNAVKNDLAFQKETNPYAFAKKREGPSLLSKTVTVSNGILGTVAEQGGSEFDTTGPLLSGRLPAALNRWGIVLSRGNKPKESAQPDAEAAPRPADDAAAGPVKGDPVSERWAEQCLACNTSAPIDYPVEEWGSSGYCTTCGGDSIFQLLPLAEVEHHGEKEGKKAKTADDAAPEPRQAPKRARDSSLEGGAGASGAPDQEGPGPGDTDRANSTPKRQGEDGATTPAGFEYANCYDDSFVMDPADAIANAEALELKRYDAGFLASLVAKSSGPLHDAASTLGLDGDDQQIGHRLLFLAQWGDMPLGSPGLSLLGLGNRAVRDVLCQASGSCSRGAMAAETQLKRTWRRSRIHLLLEEVRIGTGGPDSSVPVTYLAYLIITQLGLQLRDLLARGDVNEGTPDSLPMLEEGLLGAHLDEARPRVPRLDDIVLSDACLGFLNVSLAGLPARALLSVCCPTSSLVCLDNIVKHYGSRHIKPLEP